MKVGFIGAGNMASAILEGIDRAKLFDKNDVFVSNRSKDKLDRIEKDFSYNVSTDNSFVIKNAKDVIFICVKPQVFDEIAKELKESLDKNALVVSIMAGKTIEYLQDKLDVKNVVRVMPNTPSLVGAGISAVVASSDAHKNEYYNEVINILKGIGEVVELSCADEKYMNAITQVSGASPAFIFMMMEALADGGVNCGLPRDLAYRFAMSAVYGSGKLAVDKYKESKTHPGVLKDMVTSPAGTTIEGVRVLEENGFRGAIIDAVLQSYARSLEL